ncbi:MAG: acyl-CoA/acyl-ACP dehydrogenase [Spirochaetes bacterium]|nr:acyl-CoA/acyl-ACP dehydrogenase [Spirochaetota bacterium]
MDFKFTEQQDQLRERIRNYVETEIPRARAREIDREGKFPADLVKKFADLGLCGINVAKEYGGMGGDVFDLMIIFEEVSRRLPVLCWALGNILLYGNEIISVNGSQEQKQEFLPKLAKGEIMFSFAITEPNAGSDAAGIITKAEFKDGHWLINGSKMFITGAGVTQYTVTFARTSSSKYGGITSFIVDTNQEGYTTREIDKLGYHGSNTCEVYYENVKVLPQYILGGQEKGLNNGWKQEMKLLNQERLMLSACAIGMAQAAYEDALAYAIEKLQRGSQAVDTQAIQHTLAKMATELEVARTFAYATAWKEVAGLSPTKETSMCKYFAAETSKNVIKQGVNILGMDGSSMDHDLQRYLRDILILSIGGGTSQIQKNIISKVIGLKGV